MAQDTDGRAADGQCGERRSGGDGQSLPAVLTSDSAPEPLLLLDRHGAIVECNAVARCWFADLPALIGQPIGELFQPEDARWVEGLSEVRWLGVGERRLALRDGRRVCLEARELGDDAWALSMRDVTARVALDDELDHRSRMEALSDLAGSLARELNDPTSIVLGRLELVVELDGEMSNETRRHLEVALDHARRIAATMRNLRLVGVAGVPRIARVDVEAVVREAMDIVGPRLRARQLVVDVPDGLCAGGERATYARLFAMLLGHALDGTRRDTQLSVVAERWAEGVNVGVCGGLGGAPPETLMVDHGARDGAASGLGLSLARTLLRSVNGRLEVRRGRGAVWVNVSLPDPPPRRARARPAVERVLVVGTSRVHEEVRELLSSEGYEIGWSESAEEALTVLAESSLGGVIAQVLLPGMSGLALAEEIERRWPEVAEHTVLLAGARDWAWEGSARVLRAPLHRNDVMSALGRRVRRSS